MSFKIFFFAFTLIFFLFPAGVFAQEKIDHFDVKVTSHIDGTMTVEEIIKYDFGSADRHGIFRTIPLVSKVGNLYRIIKIDFLDIKRDGNDENYEVDLKAKETEAKIGDPDKTITGAHTYLIKYKVENGIGSNYEDHDEIFWNATGNGWTIPIGSASASLNTDFGVNPNKAACFTRSGDFNGQFCTFPQTFNPITTTASLRPGDGLTVVYGFPAGTFPKSVLQKDEPFADPDFLNFLKFYLPVIALLNFILAPYLIYWYLKHKSKVRFGPPSVNFDLPRDENKKIVPPAEAGIIDNAKLDRDDVIATIFDLANRKYIRIEEIQTVKKLLPDEIDYKIIKSKEYTEDSDFERELWERLFKDGTEVLLSDLKTDFYLTFDDLEKKAFESLVKKKFYIKNPKAQMTGLLILGVLALISLNIILGIVLIYLSRKLNGRTQSGDKLDFAVDGLKIFLKSMSRHHGWQVKNLITVEKYIPYAIALGLHDQFMEQLKIVAPNYKPGWYSGQGSFYNSYGGIYSSMSSNITTSVPSSSSGFSGGGSSGGGGGGGGGGSW